MSHLNTVLLAFGTATAGVVTTACGYATTAALNGMVQNGDYGGAAIPAVFAGLTAIYAGATYIAGRETLKSAKPAQISTPNAPEAH